MARNVHISADEVKIILAALEILQTEIMIRSESELTELPTMEEVQAFSDKIKGGKQPLAR